MICLGFTRIFPEIVDVAIYALYPESFCGENLAIRKVFAFSDSVMHLWCLYFLNRNIFLDVLIWFSGLFKTYLIFETHFFFFERYHSFLKHICLFWNISLLFETFLSLVRIGRNVAYFPMVLQSPTILPAADENLIYLPSPAKPPLQSSSFGQLNPGQTMKALLQALVTTWWFSSPFCAKLFYFLSRILEYILHIGWLESWGFYTDDQDCL